MSDFMCAQIAEQSPVDALVKGYLHSENANTRAFVSSKNEMT
jgi:hypothetical protein